MLQLYIECYIITGILQPRWLKWSHMINTTLFQITLPFLFLITVMHQPILIRFADMLQIF